jgi:hypothetical protein
MDAGEDARMTAGREPGATASRNVAQDCLDATSLTMAGRSSDGTEQDVLTRA